MNVFFVLNANNFGDEDERILCLRWTLHNVILIRFPSQLKWPATDTICKWTKSLEQRKNVCMMEYPVSTLWNNWGPKVLNADKMLAWWILPWVHWLFPAGSPCQTQTTNTADESLNAAPHGKGWRALPIMRKDRGKLLKQTRHADWFLNVAACDGASKSTLHCQSSIMIREKHLNKMPMTSLQRYTVQDNGMLNT